MNRQQRRTGGPSDTSGPSPSASGPAPDSTNTSPCRYNRLLEFNQRKERKHVATSRRYSQAERSTVRQLQSDRGLGVTQTIDGEIRRTELNVLGGTTAGKGHQTRSRVVSRAVIWQ